MRFLTLLSRHDFEVQSQSMAQTLQTLQRLDRSFDELAQAILWLASRIRSRLEADHVTPTLISDFLDLEQFEENFTSCRRELTYLMQDSVEDRRSRLEYYNNNQADSLSRLSILATFLLPLSISATVLSMQTRFSDLGVLLYDLVGVTSLLGFISLTVYLFSKQIMASRKGRIVNKSFGRTRLQPSLIFFPYAVILFLTVSFLVGMFRGEIVGLKVLGFEAAGVFGYFVIATLLGAILPLIGATFQFLFSTV